jgi:hypothetical protein
MGSNKNGGRPTLSRNGHAAFQETQSWYQRASHWNRSVAMHEESPPADDRADKDASPTSVRSVRRIVIRLWDRSYWKRWQAFGAHTVHTVADAHLFVPGNKRIEKIIGRLRRNMVPAEAIEVEFNAISGIKIIDESKQKRGGLPRFSLQKKSAYREH